MHPPPFTDSECIQLVTRRRNGAEVATPVWFVLWRDMACLRTATRFGKVKRLHDDPAVRYAPCDWDGNVSGPWLEGRAELLQPAAGSRSGAFPPDRCRVSAWAWRAKARRVRSACSR